MAIEHTAPIPQRPIGKTLSDCIEMMEGVYDQGELEPGSPEFEPKEWCLYNELIFWREAL